jgi:hypothetical protein
LASALTASVSAHAEQTTHRKSYHISGGSLGQVLSQFARDAGILFTGESTLTDGKTSKGLDGEYTVEEGFQKLLAGSGLMYTITADNAVAIKVAERWFMVRMLSMIRMILTTIITDIQIHRLLLKLIRQLWKHHFP